jgi:hypothetical protein
MSQNSQHVQPCLSKQLADKTGRQFNLLFSRVVMYHVDHPTTHQSISDLFQTLTEGLVSVSPLTIIMTRNQIYVEEEALEAKINPARLISHLKKSGVQSISFEKGLRQKEIEDFIKIFTDLNTYPSVERMKKAFARFRIQKIRINHVVYKKVTSDDKVISRKEAQMRKALKLEDPDGIRKETTTIDAARPKGLQSFSLDDLLNEPSRFSKNLIQADLSYLEKGAPKGHESGMLVLQQLRHLTGEIVEKASSSNIPNMEKVATAVQQLRQGIFDEIEAQKAMGNLFQEEAAIENEINDLSDNVLIRLVKEEYRGGEISIKRLSQILRRMIPDVRDLKRLLPKIKDTLIEEGMPLSDYFELIKELGKELKDEGLAQALHDGAEEIGLSAEALIREIRNEPKAAAELITLAAEIRKELGEGDENVLSELLVDYVERISGQMAMEEAKKEGGGGGKRIKEIMERIENELLERMRACNLDASLLDNIKRQLSQRIEEGLSDVKSSFIVGQLCESDPSSLDAAQMLNIIQNTTDEDEEVRLILDLVKERLDSSGRSSEHLQEIYDSIYDTLKEPKKSLAKLPKGALARNQILFILQGEISRAVRYPYPFSILTLRIGRARPKKLTPIGAISQSVIMYAVLERLVKLARAADYVGVFDEERSLLIMPFTDSKGAELAKERILKDLTTEAFQIHGIPMTIDVFPFLHSVDADQKPLSINKIAKAIVKNSRG